jgi:hypothetical protein
LKKEEPSMLEGPSFIREFQQGLEFGEMYIRLRLLLPYGVGF